MNMKKIYFCLTAILFITAGCSNDELANNGAKYPVAQKNTITTINATTEDANTRTTLVDGHKVVWYEDDMINVLSNESDYDEWTNYGNYFINSGVGTTSATFSGEEISGNTFYAFSPGSIEEWDVAKEQFNLYWNYSAVFGDEPEENSHVIPMAAKSSDNNMQFKQLGGLLHFQIKGSAQLTGVYLRGNNNERFPDYITIDLSSEEPALIFNLEESYQDEIYCEPENYVQMLSKTEPLDVYILLPAGMAFSKGVTLVVKTYDIDNNSWPIFEKSTNQPITISRAKVTHFTAFETE